MGNKKRKIKQRFKENKCVLTDFPFSSFLHISSSRPTSNYSKNYSAQVFPTMAEALGEVCALPGRLLWRGLGFCASKSINVFLSTKGRMKNLQWLKLAPNLKFLVCLIHRWDFLILSSEWKIKWQHVISCSMTSLKDISVYWEQVKL
jgi:hypothetical protein